ncbi:MAG TPA: hypothetical protein VHA55_10975 [Pseudorhodoplanes sp.]|jgi:hypothetical protein|nr:hypothetical protein [Pseudorhodoplanes sp.]
MIRAGLAASVAALAMLAVDPALAGRRLAVGAAGGIILPEGTTTRPIYVWPRGTRWEPADVTDGLRFREPVYTTPPGYRYIYVRGYEILPVRPHAARVHRRPAKAASVVGANKPRPACVTDIGFGRYDDCR